MSQQPIAVMKYPRPSPSSGKRTVARDALCMGCFTRFLQHLDAEGQPDAVICERCRETA